jgi:hypothetical protein
MPATTEPLTHAQRYALGLLAEEMGEAIQIIGKWLRFGDGRGPDRAPYFGQNAREMLPTELGDVLAAIDYAALTGIAPAQFVTQQAGRKLNKLLDPASVDADGNRLAPDPKSKEQDHD